MRTAAYLAAMLFAAGVPLGAAHGGNALNFPSRVNVVLPASSSEFPSGDGSQIANAQCLSCHSSGMVLRQPPQTAAQWAAIILKMRKVYGAPMPEEQVEALSAYLANLPAEATSIAEQPVGAPSRAAAIDGALVFHARCAACHQASGTGIPGVFPPLAGSPWVTGSRSALIQIALKGIQGSLTVKESTYTGVMPSFAADLNDQEIAAVLSYVRSQWGNAAGPVKVALVKSLRARTPLGSGPWHGDADLKNLVDTEP